MILVPYILAGINALEYTPVISTRYGQLRGVYQHVQGAGRVAKYLGIPYATPPVAGNRLSPTRAPSQWRSILDATVMPPACPQNPPKQYRSLLQRQSEDCLYLNLYVPDGPKGLPVTVLLHGEGFDWGAGSLYDGSHLASHGHVLVATLNFRVGILGFFNGMQQGSRRKVANYGLMDQLASLHWLQENIGRFGGDPAQVTVMAHSYGAACLSLLILSPAAAGL
ncbi:Carboxylesterase type B [Trinorchestia longiramus]|nr:Carboxylesterase type B [Trinorchestia longiramus]